MMRAFAAHRHRGLPRADRRGYAIGIWVPASRNRPSRASKKGPGGGFRRGGGNPNDTVPVLAIAARLADVPVYLDGVGSAKALNTVLVRSQVDGKLMKIAFKEGQEVTQGSVIAKIDPTTYQAQYDIAVAKKAQDEATLANAKLDLERYMRLAATNAVQKQQVDTQKALVDQLTAQTQSDQASINNAKATLDYTDVVAPLDRADRHPPGRRGQHHAFLRRHRDRDHHPDQADRGAVQPAAAESARPQQGHGGRAIAGAGDRRRRHHRGRQRQGGGHQQSGRPDHRHGPAQGRVS